MTNEEINKLFQKWLIEFYEGTTVIGDWSCHEVTENYHMKKAFTAGFRACEKLQAEKCCHNCLRKETEQGCEIKNKYCADARYFMCAYFFDIKSGDMKSWQAKD